MMSTDEHRRRIRDHARLLERCPHGTYLFTRDDQSGRLYRVACFQCTLDERDALRAALIAARPLIDVTHPDTARVSAQVEAALLIGAQLRTPENDAQASLRRCPCGGVEDPDTEECDTCGFDFIDGRPD